MRLARDGDAERRRPNHRDTRAERSPAFSVDPTAVAAAFVGDPAADASDAAPAAVRRFSTTRGARAAEDPFFECAFAEHAVVEASAAPACRTAAACFAPCAIDIAPASDEPAPLERAAAA